MGAIADLLKSERGIVAIALLAAATVGLLTDRLTTDQWVTYTQWLFVTYAASKTVTGGLAILKGSGDPAAPAGTPSPSDMVKAVEASRAASTIVPLLLVTLLGGAALAGSTGCTSSQRIDTIRNSLVAVNAARDGFTAWDGQHQRDLVKRAATRVEAEAAIAAYHQGRQPVLDGFELAYRLLALAATQNDDPSLNAALLQVSTIVDLVKRLTSPALSMSADREMHPVPLRRRAWTPTRPVPSSYLCGAEHGRRLHRDLVAGAA